MFHCSCPTQFLSRFCVECDSMLILESGSDVSTSFRSASTRVGLIGKSPPMCLMILYHVHLTWIIFSLANQVESSYNILKSLGLFLLGLEIKASFQSTSNSPRDCPALLISMKLSCAWILCFIHQKLGLVWSRNGPLCFLLGSSLSRWFHQSLLLRIFSVLMFSWQ